MEKRNNLVQKQVAPLKLAVLLVVHWLLVFIKVVVLLASY